MRLFFRIYFTFVIAIAAALAASVFVSTGNLRDSLPGRWATIAGGPLALAAQMAADRYAEDGPDAARAYLTRFAGASRLDLSFYDASGKLLLAVPRDSRLSRDLALRALAPAHRGQPLLSPVQLTAAFPARNARTNARFVLVGRAQGGLIPNLLLPVLRAFTALAVLGVICVLLTRSVLRPIVALQLGARRLAGGDLQYRVASVPPLADRQDILGDLGRDFDHMAERLQAAQAAQNRLLADVSHELRSPLTRLGFAVALARQQMRRETTTLPTAAFPAESGNAPLDRIEREADRMNALIGELLTLARWENDATQAPRVPIDLVGLVQEIAADADYEARAGGKSCLVEVVEAREPMSLFPANAELLRRAIENVVRNAVRYTAEHSPVEIALRYQKSDRQILVTVRDHGPGVPDEALASLFRPFFRIADARDRVTGGTGLGLAIADRAIRAHAGEIRAENAAEGGLLVTIILPLPDAD